MRIPLNKQQGKARRRQRRTFKSEIAQPTFRTRRKTEARPVAPQQPTGHVKPHAEPGAPSTQLARPRPSRWRLALTRFPAAIALLSLVTLLIYVSAAQQFYVFRAEVVGSHHIESDTIYQASGIHEQNIFWIRPNKAAEAVVYLDGIRTARVRCRLPARVTIEVTERQPVVLWRAEAQGSDLWLDEEGVVLPYHGVVSDTVFVVDSSQQMLNVGDRVQPEGIVTSVRQLDSSLPEVSLFYYQPDRGLSFMQKTAHGSWPVYVGDSSDLAHKIQVLQALTDYFVEHKMRPTYVDVRWADYPVFGKPDRQASMRGN